MANQTYVTDKRSRIVLFEGIDTDRDGRTNLGKMLDPTKVKVADTAVFDPEFIEFYNTVIGAMAAEPNASEASKNGSLADYSLRNARYKDRTITIAVSRADLAASAE
jgi:hypothetical protein